MDGIEVELAIQEYQATLEVYTRRDFPFEWAQTQHNLGVIYWNRIKGDRKDNIKLAIQAALEVFTRNNHLLELERIQHNLGTAYWERVKGDCKENIKLAIAAFYASSKVYTRHNFPDDWVIIQDGLDQLEDALAMREDLDNGR